MSLDRKDLEPESDETFYDCEQEEPREIHKISRFYLSVNENVTYDLIWNIQLRSDNQYFLKIPDKLKENPNLKILQYDIPKEDVEQQKKMYNLYQQTKLTHDRNAFASSDAMPAVNIAKFDYCRGYWTFKKEYETIYPSFFICPRFDKLTYFSQKKSLATQAALLQMEFEQNQNKITFNAVGILVSGLITAIGFGTNNGILSFGLLLFLQQCFSYKDNASEEKKLQDTEVYLRNKNAFSALSIFSSQGIKINVEPIHKAARLGYGT